MANEIVLYKPNEQFQLEVQVRDETVWLTQQQMAQLFGVAENNITYHIRGIYKTQELEPTATAQKIRVVRQEGNRTVARSIDFYNLADAGVTVEWVPLESLIDGYGAAHCMTQVLKRY